jgi:diguanylate cyclase (GGDEF)-like protein
MFNEQSKHALLDSLTGLYNKQEFEANLEKEFHRARRYIYNFTLAFIDIDRMGELNAKLGEDFGNYVIYQLSALLKEIFRRTDLIYRFGGDKIIVLMPMTPITKAIIPIERLKERISEYEFKKGEQKSNITVSVGLCANYSRFTEPEDLLNSLKVSLLRAKEAGRNKIDIYE